MKFYKFVLSLHHVLCLALAMKERYGILPYIVQLQYSGALITLHPFI